MPLWKIETMFDSTKRFSSRVENYVRFRPGYPPEMGELLRNEYGLTEDSEVGDIGSGTGLLSRLFLDAGLAVTGVEPNREMREAGDALLAGYARFRSIDGTAEATTLADSSADLITAAQAFHWFDVDATRREWIRVLRPDAAVALIWNERFIDTPFMREVEAITDKYAAAGDPEGKIREAGRGRIGGLFGPSGFRVDEFPNHQSFDLAGLVGRISSSSYLPMAGEPAHEEMSGELQVVFERWAEDGLVRFLYRTKVFHGRLSG
jgi:SAM-dependent methyltransferase